MIEEVKSEKQNHGQKEALRKSETEQTIFYGKHCTQSPSATTFWSIANSKDQIAEYVNFMY